MVDSTSYGGSGVAVPYATALRAFAFAGISYNRAAALLRSLDFLVPADDAALRKAYRAHRREAKDIDPDYCISKHLVQQEGLDPLYSWAMSDKDPAVCEASRHMERILDDLQHPLLRRAVDIMLFLKRTPEEVTQALKTKADTPVPRWTPEDVALYQRLFWNVEGMMRVDWERYGSWWPGVRAEYRFRYVFDFPTSSVESLLWDAGMSPGMTIDQQTELLMNECFLRARHAFQDNHDEDGIKYVNAYRQLMGVARKSLMTRHQEKERDKLDDQLDRISVMISTVDERMDGQLPDDGIISSEELGNVLMSQKEDIHGIDFEDDDS